MESYPNPILLMGLMSLLGLAPFIAILTSSFVKLVVVMQLTRSALGLQQEPPNMAISGIAIILTIYIMAPIGMEMYKNFESYGVELTDIKNPAFVDAVSNSAKPLQDFLALHSSQAERDFFIDTTKKLWPEKYARDVNDRHLLVLIPAFLISELTTAFQIGFLIYLPFVIIDLIVSNILMSLGMMMVSPMGIALPVKLLLFVLVDGWSRLLHGLLMSYG
ncbi:type III secretion system export apparatus subunit SctR [Thiolinea disciformis]|uniref:type III secretion system export apparatus subunit SctR n=1 Tax=Thiolinea disciformis TaxID=125614 RepID=UPI0003A050FA|nr:type III secretion system export apparatus subunit SctR [Thiolinea disciformis]